jgi:hypothetical protein
MEVTKIEIEAVEKVISETADNDLRDLGDLQLVMIGGGIGEVIVA